MLYSSPMLRTVLGVASKVGCAAENLMDIFKGIFSDSNNIFLWYESEDINKKSLFPKFQLIPILHFRVMHDYVCFIAPIGYCVE